MLYAYIPFRSHYSTFAPQRWAFPRIRSNIRPRPYHTRGRGSPSITWTHRFVCLSDPNQDVVPSASEKFCLKESGLGEKKIVFPISAGWETMKEEILRSFPKLRCGGGIELLRTDGPYSKSLTKICPQQWTSVSKLKEHMQQARIYVRPGPFSAA